MQSTPIKKRIRRTLKWLLWVVLVQFILINISAALHAYRFTHFYDDPSLRESKPPSSNIFKKTWKLFAGSRYPKSVVNEEKELPFETVHFKTASGIAIESWYCPHDSAKGTILVFHGITSNKSFLLDESVALYKMGYNILLTDLRAHGNSGGTASTYGVRETEEVKMAWDFAAAKGEKNIYLYGVSMGAVVVTRAVADYGLQPAGLILEAPFASLQDHYKARARNLGFPAQPAGFLVTFWTGVEQGFNGFTHKTTRYAKKIQAPVLLQYGLKDTYVTRTETNRIFESIAAAAKKLVVYEEAGHESLLRIDPVTWLRETENFLAVHGVK